MLVAGGDRAAAVAEDAAPTRDAECRRRRVPVSGVGRQSVYPYTHTNGDMVWKGCEKVERSGTVWCGVVWFGIAVVLCRKDGMRWNGSSLRQHSYGPYCRYMVCSVV